MKRYYGRGWKKGSPQRKAGLVEHLSQRHWNSHQMRGQAIEIGRRKRREQGILFGGVRLWDGIHEEI
jgi:hypothetical protein